MTPVGSQVSSVTRQKTGSIAQFTQAFRARGKEGATAGGGLGRMTFLSSMGEAGKRELLLCLSVALVWFHCESCQGLKRKTKEPLDKEMVGEVFKTRRRWVKK